mmetsp:Transcript_37859/g.90610  ORF Transcript_37859/g.90610 Transcript_37859/m.90610 type:complete len:320 (+) Transcript_37859:151-1110(+)
MILLVIWPYNTETRGLLQVHVARYFRMKNEVSKTEESSSSTTNKLFTNTTDNAGNSYSIPFIPVKLRFMDNDAIELQNLHIPKTGGRTFIRYLDDFQIRHVSSEGSFKDDRIINSEFVSTILREPTRHVLAQWNHCRGKEGSNKPFAWVPFTAWVKYWSEFNLQYNGSFERHIFNTYKGTFQVPEGDPFNCFYIPINLQASRLGAFDKNIAEKRISTLFFVGVQDMFAESVCVLLVKLRHHQAASDLCSCSTRLPRKQIRGSQRKYDADSILNQTDLSAIDSITNLDQYLHALAKKRLISEIEMIRKEVNSTFLRCGSN